jgi:hypothetical protein
MKTSLLFLILIPFFSTCDEDGKSEKSKKHNYVQFYCDISSSIDSSKQETMFIKMDKIINSLSDNMNLESFYTLVMPFKEEDTEIEELYYNQSRQDKLSNFYSAISNEIKQVQIKNKNSAYTQSCIINTLRIAFNNSNSKDTSKWICSLYYFSDMIEQCEGKKSDLGKMFFCSRTMFPNFQELQTQIEEKYNGNDINLKKVLGNRIYFIRTTEDNEKENCLSPTQINDLWYLVLKKVGYSKSDLIYFSYNP